MALKTNRSLTLILNGTGSQWSEKSTGVMCSQLGVFAKIQAAAAVPVSDENLAKAITQSVALVPTHGRMFVKFETTMKWPRFQTSGFRKVSIVPKSLSAAFWMDQMPNKTLCFAII